MLCSGCGPGNLLCTRLSAALLLTKAAGNAGSMRFEDLGVKESPVVQCMTACFRDGQVAEIGLLSAVEQAVLGTAQCALSRDPLTAPLSWVDHDRFRHGCSDSGEDPHAQQYVVVDQPP